MAASPHIFGIEFESEPGRALRDAVAQSHGERLARIASVPDRVFGIVPPAAPGVTVVGAESAVEGLPQIKRIGAAGVGLTMADALASCLGETVERLSTIEQSGDVERTATLSDVGAFVPASASALFRSVASSNGVSTATACDWVSASDLESGRGILIPADWCLRRASDGPLRMADTALSTGVAAGASEDDAGVRAMLELVERDAVALWWIGGRRGRPVGLDTAAGLESAMLLERIRQGASGRASWLIDITSDIDLPCIAAISVAADGRGFACGMAARTDTTAAARAAIFEMCQMELAYAIVDLKRRQAGDDALNDVDRTHLVRSQAIDAATCDLIHPAGVPRDRAAGLARGEQPPFIRVQDALLTAGIEVALVGLTRPAFEVPVITAFAPDLQRMPSGITIPRLETAISETGGGARWTNGVALL